MEKHNRSVHDQHELTHAFVSHFWALCSYLNLPAQLPHFTGLRNQPIIGYVSSHVTPLRTDAAISCFRLALQS